VGGKSSMPGYALLQFGVTRGSSTGGAISRGRGSVELIALWSPAVMIALEIMSTVKRIANPSAVRRTRKARMTELERQQLRGCCAAARCFHTPMRSTVCRRKPERLLNLGLAGVGVRARAAGRAARHLRAVARQSRHGRRAFIKDIHPVGEGQRAREALLGEHRRGDTLAFEAFNLSQQAHDEVGAQLLIGSIKAVATSSPLVDGGNS
jgi:hypothetical protein